MLDQFHLFNTGSGSIICITSSIQGRRVMDAAGGKPTFSFSDLKFIEGVVKIYMMPYMYRHISPSN